ncbi:hypothetical protein ACIBEJ_33595 [Nonomuraea sp. NPDC050790]|uniref:hypothetical protein n=1 Tax=Nonomuraea sp. NPDC050790 TaxID=3364371 RepID=UPI0037AD2E03
MLTLTDAARRAEAGMARAAELGVETNIAVVDAGELPITDEHGRTIGANGVSGGEVQQDTQVAEACLAAA